ncbi:hypothetical protein DFH06DRAFT_588749 [Mycena polygramma]|nr:hypothetical protein DFH06DRAFT_588749 [Mycena polygramma]
MKVTLNGTILADSEKTVLVEGNHYFPFDHKSLNKADGSLFTESDYHPQCVWKGTASYYNYVPAEGQTVNNIAWYYPKPKDEAMHIKDHVAFDKNKVQFE